MNPNARIKRIEKAAERLTPTEPPRLVVTKELRDGEMFETVFHVDHTGRAVVVKVLRGISMDDI